MNAQMTLSRNRKNSNERHAALAKKDVYHRTGRNGSKQRQNLKLANVYGNLFEPLPESWLIGKNVKSFGRRNDLGRMWKLFLLMMNHESAKKRHQIFYVVRSLIKYSMIYGRPF